MYYISMSYYSKQTLSFDFSNSFLDTTTEITTEKKRLFRVGCRLDTDSQW